MFVETRLTRIQSYGHLNNVVYVRYAESSRIAFIHQILGPHLPPDLYQSYMNGTELAIVLKSIEMNYRSPVVYPDVITMATRIPIKSITKDRMNQEFIAVSHAQERIVAYGKAVIVSFDTRTQSKADLPQEVIDCLRDHQGEPMDESKL